VEAGVAVKFEEEMMFDKEGNITDDPEKMYGRPLKYMIIRPEQCVFVDETGCNTNCKNDGFIGGQRFVMARDQTEGGRLGVTTDLHFTVLTFTAGTGEPIMCSIILKSEKLIEDIPLGWSMGVDMSKNIETGETTVETYRKNYDNGAMIGGPVCRFNGKEIPCFVCCSPNASITSDLLASMLEEIDKYNVFPRSEEEGMPFLLLDGHGSRTRLPFLRYITNPAHRWKVCIGVPYGTHLWQPHNSTELNGTYKIKLFKEKHLYLMQKPIGKRDSFLTTDIIPLLNRIWEDSLGNRRKAKKAIVERGWGPLTYVLLDHKSLQKKIQDNTDFRTHELDLTTVNVFGEVLLNKLDTLIEDRLKSNERKRKYEWLLEESADREKQIKRINTLTSITSGKLCAQKIFCISDEVIRDRLEDMEAIKDQKNREKKQRADVAKLRHQTKFRAAARTFFDGGHLHCDGLRVILQETKQKGDSPIKKKFEEMRSQLERRKSRMDIYNWVVDEDDAIDDEFDANDVVYDVGAPIDVADVANANPSRVNAFYDPTQLGPYLYHNNNTTSSSSIAGMPLGDNNIKRSTDVCTLPL
jgi:hypothetical protein